MEDKNKDAKYENKRGKTVFKNDTNRFCTDSTENLNITPRTCHLLSDCTQSNDRKFPYYQCSAKFRFKSCFKQHLRIHSGDIALWQTDYLTREILKTQLMYWKGKLVGFETLNLVTDYSRPSQINYAEKNLYFGLDENTSKNLRNLAEELKVSLYTVILSGYCLMLRSYTNQDDIVIGTLVANNHCCRIKKMIGIFVNTLAIRIRIDSTSLLKDFIRQVGGDIITSQSHQDLPFEKLVEELDIPEDTSRHLMFQTMFALQNFETSLQSQHDKETDLIASLEPLKVKTPYTGAKFALTATLDSSGGVQKGVFTYAIALYREETIQRFIETYVHILNQLSTLVVDQTKKEHTTIADLSYLSNEQYHQIIHSWNATDEEYPADKTIHQLFEEQVAKTPDNVAVVYAEVRLTYRELNIRVNRLAGHLIEKYNIESDNLVALCLDRSENMLIPR